MIKVTIAIVLTLALLKLVDLSTRKSKWSNENE